MERPLQRVQQDQERSENENERAPESGDEQEPPDGTASTRSSDATAAGAESAEADTEEQSVSLDQIFGMLRNQRRRQVLRTLTETARIELDDLAEQIAAQELDKPRKQLTSQERKRLYVALYQAHLPKLADVGAITYDERQGLVEPGPAIDSFTSHLPDVSGSNPIETQERRWRDYIPDILN